MCAVVLAACAGGETTAARNDYVRGLNAAQERFARTAREVSGAITGESSARQYRRGLVRYGTDVSDFVRKLRALTVPGEVRAEHVRLVAALAEFRGEVSTAVRRLRFPTTRAVDDAQRQLAGATTTLNAKLDESTRAINRKLQAD